ncbi:MAG: phosphomannomutase/phosphoglucomutase [Patescibacteria group bacterium]
MQPINPFIFKAYDVRGVYPSELDEDMAYRVGQALARFSGAKEVLVGRDMRISSPSLNQSLIKGINDAGVDVVDVGLVSTPTFYFAVRHLGIKAGIQVSASHNPKEYNGFKVVLCDEKGIIKVGLESGLDQIRDLAIAGDFAPAQGIGSVREVAGIQEAEIDEVMRLAPLPEDMPRIKVVADPANAMGAQFLESYFARVPQVALSRMNFELDGNFPAHEPNPLIFETLDTLRERVVEEGAHLGVAPDGDGDRIFFIDERGEIVPASLTTALVAREVLREKKGKILYDVRYAWSARRVIEDAGGTPMMSKVGHAFISNALREAGGLFAGESSGHYFFRESGFAEAPLLVLAHVLRVMTREKKPLSQILAPLAHSVESGEINFKLANRGAVQEILASLEARFRDGEVTKIDGLTIEFPDWRFSLRASNTEPLLRLNLEAKTGGILEEKRAELMDIISAPQV